MRTTIDGGGRVVIPKSARDQWHLRPGSAVEITVRDGWIEIAPAPATVAIAEKDGVAVAAISEAVPPLTAEEVRATTEQVRR
ncbi:MAG: AbrB/MazE/SpoVT family DNA-binding domain-containing protein [Candidatus Nanopelagicales bacterium]